MASTTHVDPYALVVGQPRVVDELRACARQPVHAYLLVGPPGSGTEELAVAFAADVLAAGAEPDEVERVVSLVHAGHHPDVVVVGAEGAAVRREEAETLRAAAVRTPVEGARKVLIGVGFDVIQPEAAALLLKTVEEPAPSTVIVLLAEDVPAELVTLASRCVRVEVGPRDLGAVREVLVAEAEVHGWPTEQVEAALAASGGDLDRARLLASDERSMVRREAWLTVPDRLDGTGAAVYQVAEELLVMIDEVLEPLGTRHAEERSALEEDLETYGLRRSVLKDLEARHKRQARRVRRDELHSGLGLLARRYRDAAVEAASRDDPRELERLLSAQGAIDELVAALVRNPNERLQLQALLLRLPPLG